MEKIYASILLLIFTSYVLVTLLPIIANNYVVTSEDGFVHIERRLDFKERTVVLWSFSLSLIIITEGLIYLYNKTLKKRVVRVG